ncbi:MAG TPA: hypothetical protein VKQ06_05620, partial [Gammaproteobacteria bacterium]|nr:hypothetical protein [Gammaproteobacteria bacterium]
QIFAADGRPIWSQSNVSADEEPAVTIVTRDLPHGAYRLLVTAERDAQIAADYAIELVRSNDRQ